MGRYLTRLSSPTRGRGIVIWAGIVGASGLVLGVLDGVKITADAHIAFLKEHLQPWRKRQRITFKRSIMFMHNNASSHSPKKTTQNLKLMGFRGPRKMKWPACSLDLSPVEHMWSIIKRHRFRSEEELWQVNKEISRAITTKDIWKMTSSISRKASSSPY